MSCFEKGETDVSFLIFYKVFTAAGNMITCFLKNFSAGEYPKPIIRIFARFFEGKETKQWMQS